MKSAAWCMVVVLAAVAAPLSVESGKPPAPFLYSVNYFGSRINITWLPIRNGDIGGYNLYRNGKYYRSFNPNARLEESPTSSGIYRWAESGPRFTKYYMVAYDKAKTSFSARSVTRTATGPTSTSPILTVAPSRPQDVTARFDLAARPSYVRVSWKTVKGAIGYNVYKNDKYLGTANIVAANLAREQYVDKVGRVGDRYYITAFDSSKTKFSPKSLSALVT